MDPKFSHLDGDNQPNMVNVGAKNTSERVAKAQAIIDLPKEIIQSLNENQEIQSKKGPIFQTAILAGIMGAKKTAELIPLCHPIGMDDCKIHIEKMSDSAFKITCTARVTGKTGVEMEALTGASIAALTVYDMCKALSHDILIKEIKLMEKTGGKRDFKRSES